MIVKTHKPDKKMELYEFTRENFIWIVIDNIQHDSVIDDTIKTWKALGFETLITSTAVDEIMIIDGTNAENEPVELKVEGEKEKYVYDTGRVAWVRINNNKTDNINPLLSSLMLFFDNLGFEVLLTSDVDEVEIVNGNTINGGIVK